MNRSRILMLLLGAVMIALLSLSFACGGDDDDSSGDDDEPAATTPAEDGDDDDGDDGGATSFDVVMADNTFDPGAFTVAEGADITFNLTNEGAAIHNMRIAGADGEYNTADDGVSDPDLVSGGDSAVLEWTAPSESGEVAFQCDFHPTDMKGTITVD